MNKFIVFVVLIFINTSFILGQNATISISHIGTQTAGPVFFPITLEKIDGGMSTFQFFINYDTLVLTPVNVAYPNQKFPEVEWMNNLNNGSGVIVFTWLNTNAQDIVPNSDEVICVLEFNYIEGNQFSQIEWVTTENTEDPKKGVTGVWNEKGEKFNLELKNGSIGIQIK